jgi:diguanylate cyclase (GGDEF)-like protein
MLDMDNLKNINDEYGHAAGDSMLRYLVEVIRSELRTSDKLYRFGGDEFLIVFPGAEATQVGRRIRAVLSACEPLSVGRARIPMRVSVGTAAYTSAENLTGAIDAADRAMYAEKMTRKNSPAAGVAQSA